MKKTTADKILNDFTSITISLKDKPTENLVHLYADYLELVSLFSNRNYISNTDFLDRLRDEGMMLRDKQRDEDQAEDNDVKENLIDSIFREIQNRIYLFGEDYPFELLQSNKIILKESNEISNRKKVYLLLLLASSLNLFGLFQDELTTEFETISYEALKNFMPTHAVVKSIGQNTNYTGNAVAKIKQLASDMIIEVDERSLKQVSPKGNKEYGLDLIGWIPTNDTVSNLLTILCQCACGKDWHKKIAETGRYENFFDFHRKRPIHAMFIPYSLISYQESIFYQSILITDTILFDRKRILFFIQDLDFFDVLNSKLLVEKCIEYEEDIV